MEPVQVRVWYSATFERFVATLGDGDSDGEVFPAFGSSQEHAIEKLLALNGFAKDTPYVLC